MSDTTHDTKPRRKWNPDGIFYGWWIVTGGSILTAMGAGLNFYGFSAFFLPLSMELGQSRSALSGVFALARLEGGFLGPIEGFLIDKYGPRKMMFIGIPLMGFGFILLATVNSLLGLYLVYILTITLGSSLGTFAPATAAVANWFLRKRSRAIGFVMSGVALGGALLLPVLGWWIEAYGWRSAAIASGILILTVGLPLAMLMRHRPEDYGLLPDGSGVAGTVPDASRGTNRPRPVSGPEIGGLQSLKTTQFWFLGASLSLRAIVTTGFTIHFVAMMVDRGFSFVIASSLLGSVALVSLPGRIGFSWLGDFVDKRYLLAATLGVTSLTMLAMSQVQSQSLLVAVLVLYAVAYGGSIVLPVSLQADYFGRKSFATIRGLTNTVQTVGTLIGPIFAGVVYDRTGDYLLAFTGFAIAGFVATLLVAGIRKPNVADSET